MKTFKQYLKIDEESEYQGKKVKLNDPFRAPKGDRKKFYVYVKNEKGNVIRLGFGDPNMEIKRDDPKRRNFSVRRYIFGESTPIDQRPEKLFQRFFLSTSWDVNYFLVQHFQQAFQKSPNPLDVEH